MPWRVTPRLEESAGGHGGTSLLADRRLLLGAAAAMVPDIASHHLEHAGYRDGEQSSEDSGQFHRDQDGDQDAQRVQLHGPSEDERLKQVVLQLLVQQEE